MLHVPDDRRREPALGEGVLAHPSLLAVVGREASSSLLCCAQALPGDNDLERRLSANDAPDLDGGRVTPGGPINDLDCSKDLSNEADMFAKKKGFFKKMGCPGSAFVDVYGVVLRKGIDWWICGYFLAKRADRSNGLVGVLVCT